MSDKPKDGELTPNPSNDPFEELKGQLDEKGIPKHPEERAEYYQTKFSESARGVQTLVEKNKDLEREIGELKKPKFTQDELSKLIPGYDNLAPEQQKAIFESWSNMQRDLDGLKQSVATIADRQIFDDGFRALIKNPEFVILKKHKDSFKDYAYSDEYRGIDDLTIIARNYIMEKKLYENPNPTPPNPENPVDRPGLDTNRGGIRKPVVTGGFTAQEIADMRTKDPQKYNRLAAAGKLTIKEE